MPNLWEAGPLFSLIKKMLGENSYASVSSMFCIILSMNNLKILLLFLVDQCYIFKIFLKNLLKRLVHAWNTFEHLFRLIQDIVSLKFTKRFIGNCKFILFSFKWVSNSLLLVKHFPACLLIRTKCKLDVDQLDLNAVD